MNSGVTESIRNPRLWCPPFENRERWGSLQGGMVSTIKIKGGPAPVVSGGLLVDHRAMDIRSVLSVENHVTWKPSGLPPRYMLGYQSDELASSHTALRHHRCSMVVVCMSGAVILVDAGAPLLRSLQGRESGPGRPPQQYYVNGQPQAAPLSSAK